MQTTQSELIGSFPQRVIDETPVTVLADVAVNGDARILGNLSIKGNLTIFGTCTVIGNINIKENATIFSFPNIRVSTGKGYAVIFCFDNEGSIVKETDKIYNLFEEIRSDFILNKLSEPRSTFL